MTKFLKISKNSRIIFWLPDYGKELETLPFYKDGVKAGFAIPAEHFMEERLNLNDLIIENKDYTFFAQVKGDSMVDYGIYEDDILAIDRSKKPVDGKFCLCFIDGEYTVKKIRISKSYIELLPGNKDYPIIKVTKENEFIIWGVVVSLTRKF